MFKEVTFSYNILSDPDKRRQYDTAGFEVRYVCMPNILNSLRLTNPCVLVELTFYVISSGCSQNCASLNFYIFIQHEALLSMMCWSHV